jgi:hypothetical protein
LLFCQHLHIFAFVLGNDPLDGHIPDLPCPVAQILISGIVEKEKGLQRIVPAVYIQDLSFAPSQLLFLRDLLRLFLSRDLRCSTGRAPLRGRAAVVSGQSEL